MQRPDQFVQGRDRGAIEHPQLTWKFLLFGTDDPRNWQNLIFCISEIGFKRTPHLTATSLFPTFPFFAGTDHNGRRDGGLLMHTSSDSCTSTTKRRHDLECLDVKCITLELHSDPKHILFFTYRQSQQSPTIFFDCMRILQATAENEAAIPTLLGLMNTKTPLGKRRAHTTWQEQNCSVSYFNSALAIQCALLGHSR